jgi:hypothetical protein
MTWAKQEKGGQVRIWKTKIFYISTLIQKMVNGMLRNRVCYSTVIYMYVVTENPLLSIIPIACATKTGKHNQTSTRYTDCLNPISDYDYMDI